MASQLGAESAELKNMQAEEEALKPFQKEETISKQYIQDLYRFFKLFPRRAEFRDIFELPLNYHRLPAFQPVVMQPNHLEKIALYYFEKNNSLKHSVPIPYSQKQGTARAKFGRRSAIADR